MNPLDFFRQAGAVSESDTERDGAFSYHAETHAAGIGAGVGVTAAATGEYRLAGVVVSMAFGTNRGETALDPKVIEDIRQEPHYALGGLVAGVTLGKVTKHLPALPF